MSASQPPSEIVFVAEPSPEGGFTARAVGVSIFTQAATFDALRANIREAVECHYADGQGPQSIRLRMVREEVIPLDG